MKKGKLAVVALGGNAIIRSDQSGAIEEQNQNVRDTLENLLFLLDAGYNLVITHGNGPQVGNILMRNDAGFLLYDIAQMPLDICVADSQGGIGYMIEREFRNLLESRNIEKDIVTMVTQVVVDKDDPSIQNPSKRIGKSYTKEEAEVLNDEKGWVFKISSKNQKYRRVVPSPKPLKIFNTESIQRISSSGSIVIAVGGGGVPVYVDENELLQPVEGVIDKDLASSLLATQIGADEFYVLTDVPYIYINFNKENQERKEFLDIADTERYIEEGHFGEGSMGPKVKAALTFVKNGGEKSVITEATKLNDKSYGSKITANYDS